MKFISVHILLFVILIACSHEQDPIYTVAAIPWAEELGNHRALIEIRDPADAVHLRIPWRRHDPNPDKKRFIILRESSGDTIANILRVSVNQEECELVFGPVPNPGDYAFYYLPFKPDPEHGFYRYGYLPPEPLPDNDWVEDNGLRDPGIIAGLPLVFCRQIQARTEFDSFYPMEVIPTANEKETFLDQHNADYLIFPESRNNPIRMRMEIPQKWIHSNPGAPFKGTAMRNEYFAFQLGLYAVKQDIKNVKFQFSELKKGEQIIPATSFTCFNTEGIDPYGNPFTIHSDVKKSTVQAYWIGLDIGSQVQPGTYSGIVTVIPENSDKTEIPIQMRINDEVLIDRGDSEPWRHSRIRWLNSTMGLDPDPVPPFTPILPGKKNEFQLLGKEIIFSDKGLPESIEAWGTEILSRSIDYVLKIPTGRIQPESGAFELDHQAPGVVEGHAESNSEEIRIRNKVTLESDGYINFKIRLEALKNINVADFSLEIPFRDAIAQYMMGMGLPGSKVPDSHRASWDGPQDSFWIGNTHGGLHCELRGSDYHGPLLSLYHPPYPDSWYNEGKGSLEVQKRRGEVVATIHSGERILSGGEEIVFEFSLIITPTKKLNTGNQFTDRYFQNYPEPVPDENAVYEGVKIINVHHANRYNPYINYPFVATAEMKEFADHWHARGKKVKIYYTVRELSTRVFELWALRSLGHEILLGQESTYDWLTRSGIGQGHPWLVEHLEGDYAPAWYSRLENGGYDAAIVTTSGFSRWYNYYIEGLRWLVKNMDIDGLYLDDVAYDRRILKRMRKVMESEKPGCIIDLHSNNDFTKGPALQYTEFFPFIDKLWFGEAFDYDRMTPESWLVEVSGIPFGLMGDMLQNGGNRWLGMLFGMTNRPPWTHGGVQNDPVPVWRFWDSFGIANATMIGFWEKDCPVRTTDPNVLATVYQQQNRALIALGSWENKPVKVRLDIDWYLLGMDKNKIKLSAPFIEGFQPGNLFLPEEPIPVDPKKGLLIVVEKSG